MNKKVLILSSADSTINVGLNDHFVSELQQRLGPTIEVIWARFNDISFEFIGGTIKPFWTQDGNALPAYDFVYFKSYYRYVEQAIALVEYCKQENIKYVCSELDGAISFSKLSQYARLTRIKAPIPHTLFVASEHLLANYSNITQLIGSPFICKAIDGKGGGANYLIQSQQQFKEALAANPEVQFVLQEFIANDSDLRVLVINKKPELVIERRRKDSSTHLNNTSQGGGAVLIPPQTLPPEALQLATEVAALFKREIAGVDLMFGSENQKLYVLEVNASPQVASGAFEEEKLQKYSNFIKNMLQ